MKNKYIIATKLTVIVLLLGLIATFTHCTPQEGKEVGSGVPASIESPTDDQDGETEQEAVINVLEPSVGVKNFEQIFQTMGTLVGIDPYTNNGVLTIYRQVEPSLPTDTDIKLFTATQQIAITKLASEFCFQLTQGALATQRARIWPGHNITAQVQVAFNATNARKFIDDSINAFWGGVLSDEEYEHAVAELTELIRDLKASDTTSTVATGRVVRGVCTAMLSSAYVTLL